MSSKLPRLKFYIDENFPVPAGKFLKSLRQNVRFVIDDKLARGKPDQWQIKQTIKTNRIFMALDRDFKHEVSLFSLIAKSSGVVLIKSSDPQSEKIKQIVEKLLKQLTARKIKGKICIASVDKISYIDTEE